MPISFKSLGSSKIQKTLIIKSTQSWTVPADVTSIEITLCGGGGAGTGSVGGGGSLAYEVLTVTPSQAYTVTIGAGGAKGSAPTSGSTSSFGNLLSIAGGQVGGNPSGKGGTGAQQYQRVQTSWGGTDGGIIPWIAYATAGANGLAGGGGSSGTGWYQSANSSVVPGIPGAAGGGYGGTPALNWNGSTFVSGITSYASDAVVNSGSGGGGGYATSLSTYGGNGGSGVAIIKYWSAL